MGKMTILVLLLALSALGSSCETKISLGNSRCIYYVTYPTSSCDSFTFQKCQYRYCSGSGKSRKCSTNTSTVWSDCSFQCCEPTFQYQVSPNGIKQCQDYLDWKVVKKPLIISFSVIGAVGIIAIIIACICCEAKCPQACSSPRQCIYGFLKMIFFRVKYFLWCKFLLRYQLEEDPSLVMSQEESKMKSNSSYVHWSNRDQQNEELTKVCGICIRYGVNLVLNCGHVYHPRCITGWLLDKSGCPKCDSLNIYPVVVYCQSCAMSYYTMDNYSDKDGLARVVREKQVCQMCRRQGIVRWIPE